MAEENNITTQEEREIKEAKEIKHSSLQSRITLFSFLLVLVLTSIAAVSVFFYSRSIVISENTEKIRQTLVAFDSSWQDDFSRKTNFIEALTKFNDFRQAFAAKEYYKLFSLIQYAYDSLNEISAIWAVNAENRPVYLNFNRSILHDKNFYSSAEIKKITEAITENDKKNRSVFVYSTQNRYEKQHFIIRLYKSPWHRERIVVIQNLSLSIINTLNSLNHLSFFNQDQVYILFRFQGENHGEYYLIGNRRFDQNNYNALSVDDLGLISIKDKDFFNVHLPKFEGDDSKKFVEVFSLLVPAEYLTPSMWSLLVLLSFFVLLISSFVAVLSFLFARRITGPLREVSSQLEKLQEGNLADAKIDFSTDKTEIGQLLRSLRVTIGSFKSLIAFILTSNNEVINSSQRLFQALGNTQRDSAEQAAILEEAAASVEEMTAASASIYDAAHRQLKSVTANVDQMQLLKISFDKSQKKREEIVHNSEKVFASTEVGLQSVDNFARDMQEISEFSKKISGIIGVIDDLADQTNLLSLNASIEAARAGEHGRGFSVVAHEVSELAKKSAKNASEIASLIKATVDKVKQGSQKVESARTIFASIADLMTSLKKDIQSVSSLSDEQQVTVNEVTHSVGGISELATDIAQSTKMQSQSGEQINLGMARANDMTENSVSQMQKLDEFLQELITKIHELDGAARKFKIE